MGWWKVDNVDTGQIACSLPSGHPGKDKGSLINAIPGRDTPDDLYNGDQPADIMGAALKRIDEVFTKCWHRPVKHDEIRACFNFVFNGRIRMAERAGFNGQSASQSQGGFCAR